MKIQKISAQKILVKCLKLKSSDLCGLFGGALGAYQIKMQKCKNAKAGFRFYKPSFSIT